MRRHFLAASTILVGLAGSAVAAPVNLSFTALLSNGVTSSVGPFNSGDTITVSFSYDTTQAPNNVFGDLASYSLGSVTVVDGAASQVFTSAGELLVGHAAGDRDEIVISIRNTDRFSIRFDMTAFETTGALFSNTDLPVLTDMSVFESVSGSIIQGESAGLNYRMVSDVPEPATLAILGFGLTALIGVRRRDRG